MTQAQFPQSLKDRLRDLLPGDPDLQSLVRKSLWQQCTRDTREILSYGMPSFFKLPCNGFQTIFCIHYPGNALLCHTDNWASLHELCRILHQLTGIREIYIRGNDVCHRCYLENGKWIQEAL